MRKIITAAIVAGIVVSPLVTACGQDSSTANGQNGSPQVTKPPEPNTDPRKGVVVVKNADTEPSYVTIYKLCDNKGNLVFITPGSGSGAHGISVIPKGQDTNSECVG